MQNHTSQNQKTARTRRPVATKYAVCSPLVDGNKRAAHAAMEIFLLLNGLALAGTVDEHERVMLDLADGHITREQPTAWLEQHIKPIAR